MNYCERGLRASRDPCDRSAKTRKTRRADLYETIIDRRRRGTEGRTRASSSFIEDRDCKMEWKDNTRADVLALVALLTLSCRARKEKKNKKKKKRKKQKIKISSDIAEVATSRGNREEATREVRCSCRSLRDIRLAQWRQYPVLSSSAAGSLRSKCILMRQSKREFNARSISRPVGGPRMNLLAGFCLTIPVPRAFHRQSSVEHFANIRRHSLLLLSPRSLYPYRRGSISGLLTIRQSRKVIFHLSAH